MSKSYGNAIDIADDEATTTKKVRAMITDPQKVRKGDPGRPEICPVFTLQRLANAERAPAIAEACKTGELGCVACKSELAERLNGMMRPLRERRAAIDRSTVAAIVEEGRARARSVAEKTVADVKRALKL
jgi:tryptophanyl-tRNA synthetase